MKKFEDIRSLIDRLEENRSLTAEEYECLIDGYSPEAAAYAAEKADRIRREHYSNHVYIRGLIEVSNYCKNDCHYCGIRRSNRSCERYRLTADDILSCCEAGYELGFRTFVLQGGEDNHFSDEFLVPLLHTIKETYPDTAITLSLGERSRESYEKLYQAGADRYLLRHETADRAHYESLHPAEMSFENRMNCLRNLREIGYQVGCGFMVGSPNQTNACLAEDLKFIEKFQPDMCGIGPFIPHASTEYRSHPAGSVELTCYLLSLIRLICPTVLLPATTALGTLSPDGREKGILSGANVVMPNLSPKTVRKKYQLYNNKLSDGDEAAECRDSLAVRMEKIGYEVVTARGDRADYIRK